MMSGSTLFGPRQDGGQFSSSQVLTDSRNDDVSDIKISNLYGKSSAVVIKLRLHMYNMFYFIAIDFVVDILIYLFTFICELKIMTNLASRTIGTEEIRAFHRDGAVLLKNVLDQHWLAELLEGLEYAHDNPDGMSAGVEQALRIDQFPSRRSPRLKAMLTDSPIPEIVGTLLNASVRFYMDQMFYKPAGLIPATPWHQDICYYNIDDNIIVTHLQ